MSKSDTKSAEFVCQTSFFDLRTAKGQLLFACIIISIGLLIQLLQRETFDLLLSKTDDKIYNSNGFIDKISTEIQYQTKPRYSIYCKSKNIDHLKHVQLVLKRFGFQYQQSNYSVDDISLDWDLLWAHDYPFTVFSLALKNLQSHQKVNHFPGSGFITNKVDLAVTPRSYIPQAFKLPEETESFLTYAKTYPDKQFVQKHNQHRFITIRNISDINYNDKESFIQEFIGDPLLIDGHKFDIGVYVILTSIDPLRIYMYKGDVLFRFCSEKYHPFDAQNINKYIVGDDYLPIWNVPSLSAFYNKLGFGMRDSFDAYMKQKDLNPNDIWHQVEYAIRDVILAKEPNMIKILKSYQKNRNFFEIMRFDLIIDNNLKVFLMEANMSPNLSSAHFKPNELLYEQVLYNSLNLVGIGSPLERESMRESSIAIENMMSSIKNLVVAANECSQLSCSESCKKSSDVCKLCLPCLSDYEIHDLHLTYREHINKGDTKRLFPVPISITDKRIDEIEYEKLSAKNKMITQWFYEKCKMESSWCS